MESNKQQHLMLWRVGIMIFLAAAVYLRLFALGCVPGVNGDEAWLGWKAFEVAHGGMLNWTTNSGNLTNPFYILPLTSLHKLFEPSPLLLRSVAVISGLLVLPVNFFICKRVFDKPTAVASTLLLALLPVNIVYSRFGWEPSQTVLFSIPVLYVALLLCGGICPPFVAFALAGVTLLAALLVHPTNFFLGGLIIAGGAGLLTKPELSLRRLAGFCALLLLGCVVMGVLALSRAPEGVHEEIMMRLGSLAWLHDGDKFLLAWLRMFDGLNALSYIAGSWPEARAIFDRKAALSVCWPDLLALVIFLLAFWSLWCGIFSRKDFRDGESKERGSIVARRELVLVAGFLVSTMLFDVLNGPEKIAVWNERYGLWAIPAGVLIISRGWVRLRELFPRYEGVIKACGVLLCGLLIVETWSGYFLFMEKTGGTSEIGFRVGSEEIHLAASRQVADAAHLAERNHGLSNPVLVSSDWFVYWPMIYFLKAQSDRNQWKTIRESLYPEYRFHQDWNWLEEVRKGHVAFADVAGSPSWAVWEQAIRESKMAYRTREIRDVSGKPVLMLKIPEQWFLAKALPQN